MNDSMDGKDALQVSSKKKLLRSPHFPIKLETQRGVATPLHWIGPVESGVCLAEEVQYMEA